MRRRSWKDKIPGGLADRDTPDDFDARQLEMGIKVEMEHTDDPETAKEIAMDHLTEFPDYYTALDKMEKELEKKKGKEATGRSRLARRLVLRYLEHRRLAAQNEQAVYEFLKSNPDPTDEEFHQLAVSIGADPDELEEVAYAMLGERLAMKAPF